MSCLQINVFAYYFLFFLFSCLVVCLIGQIEGYVGCRGFKKRVGRTPICRSRLHLRGCVEANLLSFGRSGVSNEGVRIRMGYTT